MRKHIAVSIFISAFVLSAQATAQADGPFQYHPLTPCRVADTRFGNGGVMASGADRTFQVQGLCGVPNGAKAASVNVTAVASAMGGGFLTLYPSGITRPGVSTINFVANDIVANGAIVPLGAAGAPPNGDLRVYAGAVGNTHVILDVSGYFQ
jgi:hypothetical protein